MSGRNCARAECGKAVYPMEELKCLDQVWHKQCFRCSACSMVLNMKNYKGYNKMPYCDAHYPKTQATVVADTPEMKRLQEATKNQSLVKYHAEFEKMKGKKTELADDPEIERFKKNTQIQSNVIYHGEVGKKEVMEKTRPVQGQENEAANEPVAKAMPPPTSPTSINKPSLSNDAPAKNSPYSSKQQQASTLIYSSELGGKVAPPTRRVGKIDDYDPLNGQWGSATSRPVASGAQHPKSAVSPLSAAQQNASKRPGPVSPSAKGGGVFRAMYDYKANDTDEVSFKEGDVIINCKSVDQGWMTGTVQRTGQWGMLPANYVEKVH